MKRWGAKRKAFGLSYDAKTLQEVNDRKDTTNDVLGVPLTPSESAEIAGRSRLDAVVGSLYDAGADLPAFGGAGVDQVGGGVVQINLVASASSADRNLVKNAVEKLVPAGVETEFAQVPFSYKALSTVDNSVTSDFAAGKLAKFGVVSKEQTPEAVVIMIDGAASTANVEQLKKLYPSDVVKVVQGEAVEFQAGREHTSGPVYGGEWISNAAGAQSTAGYAHAYNNSDSGAYSEITAGHCGKASVTWRQGLSYNGGTFGTSTYNNGFLGTGTSKCDCQSITPVPASAVTKKVYTSFTSLFTYTSLPPNTLAGYDYGKAVCISGAAYGDDHGGALACGKITGQNFATTTPSGKSITNLITVNMDGDETESGDSGAPVGSGGQFMGIHSGKRSNGEAFFSRSTYISSVTGATPTF